MKLNGMAGAGSGKLGSMVYSVRNGEQIVRQYQPQVANPSTNGQVQQRAKMKLMSQLATVVAPVIAMTTTGLRSKRNEFVSANFGLCTYADNAAQIDLNKVQLTKSSVGNIGFTVDRTGGTAIAVALKEDASAIATKAVYVMMEKKADGSLELRDSVVVETAGADGKFAGSLPYNAGEIVILGYTVRANSSKASAAFANMTAPTAEQVAKVIANRSLSAEDLTATETAGCTLPSGTNTGDSEVIS